MEVLFSPGKAAFTAPRLTTIGTPGIIADILLLAYVCTYPPFSSVNHPFEIRRTQGFFSITYHCELGSVMPGWSWAQQWILRLCFPHPRLLTISPHQHRLFEAAPDTLQCTVVVMIMLMILTTIVGTANTGRAFSSYGPKTCCWLALFV